MDTNDSIDLRRQQWAWAFYDWANSAFATTVIAGFFPIFFKKFWAGDLPQEEATFWLGTTNSLAAIVIALVAPALGAIADVGGARKKFLAVAAALGVTMTAGFFWIDQGNWPLAALIYGLAYIGFAGGDIFYNSLLVDVAPISKRDRISTLGFALGYLGGLVLFSLNVAMTLKPEFFGLENSGEAVRYSFLSVAIWWGLFAIPLFRYVQESKKARQTDMAAIAIVSSGFKQLVQTFAEIRKLKMVGLFLLAYWLYIDGVHTIIIMAVDFGLNLGFDPNSLIVSLLIVQAVGVPATLGMGRLGEWIGTRQAVMLCLCIYLGVTLGGLFMQTVEHFYIMAAAIGLAQGGVQGLSRALYSRLIPQDKAGEFFGFYNMVGKFSAIIGPVLVGGVTLAVGNPRIGILSIAILLVAGGVLLWFVREPEPVSS